MAAGFVYFVQRADAPDTPIKIGYATNPEARLVTLQIASPWPLCILGVVDGDKQDERDMHARFADARMQGEWFKPIAPLLGYIKECTTSAKGKRKLRSPATRYIPRQIVRPEPPDYSCFYTRANILTYWHLHPRVRVTINETNEPYPSVYWVQHQDGRQLRWETGPVGDTAAALAYYYAVQEDPIFFMLYAACREYDRRPFSRIRDAIDLPSDEVPYHPSASNVFPRVDVMWFDYAQRLFDYSEDTTETVDVAVVVQYIHDIWEQLATHYTVNAGAEFLADKRKEYGRLTRAATATGNAVILPFRRPVRSER